MKNKLYYKLSEEIQKGKMPVGYTLNTYEGVLESLYKQRSITKTKIVGGSTTGQADTSYSQRYVSVLADMPLSVAIWHQNGFIYQDKELTKPTYQAICSLRQFMSFPVQYNIDGEINQCYVSVDRGITDGRGILKNGISFPPETLSKSNFQTMAQSCSVCDMGVAISFSELGFKYFKTFFPDLNLDANKIEKLASKGYLYAQIIIPEKSGNAKVFHAKVIAKYAQSESQSGPFEVWIPLPILLLNKFSTITKVTVMGKSGAVTVGTGDITFPLSDSDYYHKTGELYNFTPNFLMPYVQNKNSSVKVSYSSTSLANRGSETQCRVRLYFDTKAASQLGSLTSQYQKELFTGTKNPGQMVTVQQVLTAGSVGDGDIRILFDLGHYGQVGKDEEKNYNTNIINAMCQYCRQQNIGFDVNRQNGGLTDRRQAGYAGRQAAKKVKTKGFTCVISVHCDAASNEKCCGSMCLYHNVGGEQSLNLAKSIGLRYCAFNKGDRSGKGYRFQTQNTGFLGALGEESKKLGINPPAVLLESAFMTNKDDKAKLNDNNWLKQFAKQTIEGVRDWNGSR